MSNERSDMLNIDKGCVEEDYQATKDILIRYASCPGRTAVLEAEGGSATASGKHFRDITIGGLKNSEEINIIFPKCGHSLGQTDSSAQQQREVGVAGPATARV